MIHYNIIVKGKVQGVFYRQSTLEKANELNISGFVKNRNDGSVYIEAEGEEKILQQFLEWCRCGPKNAVVTGIEAVESEMKGFQNFSIER